MWAFVRVYSLCDFLYCWLLLAGFNADNSSAGAPLAQQQLSVCLVGLSTFQNPCIQECYLCNENTWRGCHCTVNVAAQLPHPLAIASHRVVAPLTKRHMVSYPGMQNLGIEESKAAVHILADGVGLRERKQQHALINCGKRLPRTTMSRICIGAAVDQQHAERDNLANTTFVVLEHHYSGRGANCPNVKEWVLNFVDYE